MVMTPPATSTPTTGRLRQLSTASAAWSRIVRIAPGGTSRPCDALAIGELEHGDDRDRDQQGEGGRRAESDILRREGQLVHVRHHHARLVARTTVGGNAHRSE